MISDTPLHTDGDAVTGADNDTAGGGKPAAYGVTAAGGGSISGGKPAAVGQPAAPVLSLEPESLRRSLLRAEEHLKLNYRILDNLNVFPVPDGDTGMNMLTTFSAGVKPLREITASTMAELSDSMMTEILHGSRGNSGFILACFFTGFFETAKNHAALTTVGLAECFTSGFYHVNKSLFSPVEGTVITIIRTMTETMQAGHPSVDIQLAAALQAGRESLFRTPKMLRTLAKAGVVDSGALGFIFLMDGILKGLLDEPASAEAETDYRFTPESSSSGEEQPRLPRYCTEVLVVPFESSPENGLREFLKNSGDSIALAREADRLKVHIHTDDPDRIIEKLKTVGAVEHIKVDDIYEQISLLSGAASDEEIPVIIACVPGEGFADIFTSLGAERVIQYGKDLPTTGEILAVLDEVERKHVILLPNNKNILPAAMLARERSKGEVSIIPTRTVVQGISATYGYSANEGLERNIASMKECVELSESFSIFRSAADASFGGTEIREGEFFAITGEKILASGTEIVSVLILGLREVGMEGKCTVTCYCREIPDEVTMASLCEPIMESFPGVTVEILYGGQHREELIVSAE